MELDFKALELIVEKREFDTLIGKCESKFFDCKTVGYKLPDEEEKYELAKDVSSFANANGGFIFIGINTKKNEFRDCDEIRKICAFEQGKCKKSQYFDVIRTWIYPSINDIDFKWYPIDENSDKGIFIIKIPAQRKDLKPFLITRTLKESGGFSTSLFGYCERKQDENEPKSVEELQVLLRDGLNYSENIESRFQGIEATTQTILKLLSPPEKKAEKFEEVVKVDERIEYSLQGVGLNQKRAMVLSAYPESVVRLRTIFSSDLQSIKHKLEYPPTIRKSGFDLRTLDRANIIGEKFCRVTYGDRKVIDLYEDGALVAGFKADDDYLCWAMKELKINPVVLVESVFTFILFYEQVIEDMDTKPDKVNFRIDLHNLHLSGKKNYLVPDALGTVGNIFEDMRKFAPENSWSSENIKVDLENFQVASVAYKIVREIYLHFGIEVNKIPYTREPNGNGIIDIEQIKSI